MITRTLLGLTATTASAITIAALINAWGKWRADGVSNYRRTTGDDMRISGNGNQHSTRLGRGDAKTTIAQVLRRRMTTNFSDHGSVGKWCNDAADEVLDALRASGDLK